MAKDMINLHGQDVIVREDTAKAYRGVNWALWSIAAFIFIAATLFIIFSVTAVSDGELKSPADVQQTGGQ